MFESLPRHRASPSNSTTTRDEISYSQLLLLLLLLLLYLVPLASCYSSVAHENGSIASS
jgi:maltodextrin utilization protein YvdJ